jgi:hypothetical protein
VTAAETLELRKKIDYNVSKLSESGLKRVYEYSQMVLAWMSQTQEKQRMESKEQPSEHSQNSKVLYNGKLMNELTVSFLSGPKNYDTDEEVDEKIWEYIQEKYK